MSDYVYGWRNGWRWAGLFIREGKPVAALRQAFVTYIRGHIGETCEQCGRRYLLWHAEDTLWTRVTGYRKPEGDNAPGLYCPACFDRRADAVGVVLIWHPTVLRERAASPVEPGSEPRYAQPFGRDADMDGAPDD